MFRRLFSPFVRISMICFAFGELPKRIDKWLCACTYLITRQTNSETAAYSNERNHGKQDDAKRNAIKPVGPVRTPTILLVEDEPAVRQVTREALEMGGYRVLEADGPIAAEHIAADRETEIDVLLTDVVMPGMNGPELARQVRQLRPELVTLFMTGYAESEVTLPLECVSLNRPVLRI